MEITFDTNKRLTNLDKHGLDFAEAGRIFEAPYITLQDDRFAYPERRFQTYGFMNARLVMLAWTPTPNGIRIISMRKCNDREQRTFAHRVG